MAVLVAVAMLAAACGDDGGSGDASPTTTAPSAPTTTASGTPAATTTAAKSTFVKGCSEGKSWVDPADMSATRTVARCEPGTPEPVPLPADTKFTVCMSTQTAEFVATIRQGIAKGEFKKENLTVEVKQSSAADCYPLLAKGDVDGVYSGPEAAFHNQIIQGANLRLVAGNYFPDPKSQTGLWANKACSSWGGKQPTIADLKGKIIGSLVGGGSVIMYPIGEAVKKAGASLKDVTLKQLPGGADFNKGLKDCAVDAAWVLDPNWVDLQKDSDMVFLVGQPPGDPIGGLMYGPSTLEKDKAKGVAFMRALIRTINTYFPLKYHDNSAFMDELSTLLSQPKERLLTTPSLQFDWEIRKDLSPKIQAYHVELGAQQGAVLPEDKTTDRSFYEIAVGKRAA